MGILPLKYDGDQKKMALYAQGTQDSLIQALSAVNKLIVIARYKTLDVLKDPAFQQSVYVDKSTQTQVGKRLGAEYLFTGSLQVVDGKVSILLNRLQVSTGQAESLAQVTGKEEDLFDLQAKIAADILSSLPVSASDQEKQAVNDKLHPTSSLSAYAYFCKGLVTRSIENCSQAIENYNQAIEHDSHYAKAYFRRGNAYHYGCKQYEKAILDYNKAIEIDPRYAEAYNHRGNVYQYSYKQYEKAIQDYNKAIEIDPGYAEAYTNRGNAYQFGYGQYEKAIQDLNRAIELNPLSETAYNNRGIAYSALNQKNLAVENWRKACRYGLESTCEWLENNGY